MTHREYRPNRIIQITPAGRAFLARHRHERIIPPCPLCGLRHWHPINVGIAGEYLVRCARPRIADLTPQR